MKIAMEGAALLSAVLLIVLALILLDSWEKRAMNRTTSCVPAPQGVVLTPIQ